jgi:UDP-N-acetylglucosamine 2-epimerase (non-hydrolysing)
MDALSPRSERAARVGDRATKLLVVLGTRPEAIKLAPLIRLLQSRGDRFEVLVCSTGQHREMLDQILKDFQVRIDVDLQVMQPGQTLEAAAARMLDGLGPFLASSKPDCTLVQGDTTTAMVATMCAFFHRTPVAHVEAGLRSGNIDQPFPEEFNRRVISLAAKAHFAPTARSREHLIREGVDPATVVVTGNTAIDALLWTARDVAERPPALPSEIERAVSEGRRIILVTGHRRESFGHAFEQICLALRDIAECNPDCAIVYPVHLNPHVQPPVQAILTDTPGVILTPPLPYRPFVDLMSRSYILLTDSGGIQEEGPSLHKPVLVMREVTERPEGIEAGVARLVGTTRAGIVDHVGAVLTDAALYRRMSSGRNPYGDGHASQRIADSLDRLALHWRSEAPAPPEPVRSSAQAVRSNTGL